MKKEINVVAAIIKEGNKIFAAQRGYGEFKDGWEFPGGKVEKKESLEEALIREICEELHVLIKIDRYFDHVDYEYPSFILHMDCFLCSLQKGKIKIDVHEAYRWLDQAQLDQVEWLPADIQVVEKLKNADLMG
ncbi:mutator mutT protein [Firmicutes bacterium M10-2]|nr:mutator mutT protein [Firmicutes bacterium M10-2]